MEKEFANYEQSLALRELGFDEECLAFYGKDGSYAEFAYYDLDRENSTMNSDYMDGEKDCTAPLIQQAFRFFREKYGFVGIVEGTNENGFEWLIDSCFDKYIKPPNNFKTYEEAEQACLDKLIELAKESKQ